MSSVAIQTALSVAVPTDTLPILTRLIQEHVNVPADGVWGLQSARAVLRAITGAWADPRPFSFVRTSASLAPSPLFDERTERNLATLEPGAQVLFRPFLAAAIPMAARMGVTLVAICGRRDRAGQAAALASGASKASWGHSWHNYGLALDFGCFKDGAYLDERDPKLTAKVYEFIAQAAPAHGLEWGGSWKSFPDQPHFQVDLGRTSPSGADLAALTAGTWAYA